MTLYHMLLAVLVFASSGGGVLLCLHLGRNPLFGLVAGIAVPIAGLCLLVEVTRLWSRHRPPLPPCKNGRCTHRDYTFHAKTADGYELQCRCGDRYLKVNTPDEQALNLVDANGATTPYWKRRKRGRWVPAPAESGLESSERFPSGRA